MYPEELPCLESKVKISTSTVLGARTAERKQEQNDLLAMRHLEGTAVFLV